MKRAPIVLAAIVVFALLVLSAPDPDDFAECMTRTGNPEMCAVRGGFERGSQP